MKQAAASPAQLDIVGLLDGKPVGTAGGAHLGGHRQGAQHQLAAELG
ncbi:MAG: hypothetical protein ACRCR1_10065 [Aeromonas sp.]